MLLFWQTILCWPMQENSAKTFGHSKMSWAESTKSTRGLRSDGFGLVCNYCHEKGHWRTDCPVLRSRGHPGGKHVEPAALSAPVREGPVVPIEVVDTVKSGTEKYAGLEAFVSDCFVAVVTGGCL